MTFDMTKTVREVALEVPAATRVFERLRIDYCCGGGRRVDDACRAAGVTVGEPSQMLEEAGGRASDSAAPDFRAAALAELTRHILDTHHAYTREESARIQPLLAKVCAKHGENHPELFEVATLFRKLDADLRPHLSNSKIRSTRVEYQKY